MAAPTLNFIHGPVAGRRVELDSEELTVGRSSQNDLVLEDPLVSRLHSIFMRRGDVVLLEDLGSHNGTYVNNERLHQIRQLHHGDTIVARIESSDVRGPSLITEENTVVSEPTAFAAQTFTQRQIQVLRLARARISPNKQIAERLFVS